MKQLFYKTVRENYTSVYAREPLSRKYVVGKRYKFPKNRPAHVFVCSDLKEAYDNRAEARGGNRVLICFGKVVKKEVPCFDIDNKVWDFSKAHQFTTERETSDDFIVIDEVPLPEHYRGNRPNENDKKKYAGKVINFFG